MADRPNLMIQRDGTWYTLEELQKGLDPIYREYKATIRDCISGLNQYAAGLAANGQEKRLPELRTLVTDMAQFWVLNDGDSKENGMILCREYGGAFDQAVASARVSGQAPALSSQAQENILSGLDLYAQEMTGSGGMDRWVRQCGALAEQLREEWAVPEPRMGGMTLE